MNLTNTLENNHQQQQIDALLVEMFDEYLKTLDVSKFTSEDLDVEKSAFMETIQSLVFSRDFDEEEDEEGEEDEDDEEEYDDQFDACSTELEEIEDFEINDLEEMASLEEGEQPLTEKQQAYLAFSFKFLEGKIAAASQ